MSAQKTDAQLEKEIYRTERKRARKNSINILVILYWVLLAVAGIAIAVCLGLTRDDWVSWTTDPAAARASTVAVVFACIGAGVCAIFGLAVLLLKRQFIIGTFSILLGGTFIALLAAPVWVSCAAGGGALVLGITVLWLGDRKEKRGAKKAA